MCEENYKKQHQSGNDNRDSESSPQQKEHSIDEVKRFCKFYKLNAVQIGRWVWVKFTSKPAENMRKLLKSFGFSWSERRGMWANNCGNPSQSSQGVPWHKYPTNNVSGAVNLED